MSVVTKILQTKIQVLEKQNRLMLLSSCAVCYKRKSIFIKNQEDHLLNIVKELKNLEKQIIKTHLYRNELD